MPLDTHRIYEQHGYATKRTHLMPVVQDAPCNRTGRVEVALTLLIVLAFVIWAVAR